MTKSEAEQSHGGSDPASGEQRSRWPGAETTPASATAPGEYAALEAAFVAGLVAVIALARRREHDGVPAIPRRDLPVLAMATFTLADTVAKERVSTWLREPFVKEDADHKPVAPEGRGLRRVVGELLTCTRCMGTWSALGLVGLRTASPAAGRATANVLALAGVNDLLQSGFRLLSERTDRSTLDTENARRAAESGSQT